MSNSMVAMNTGSENELVALKRGRKEIVSQDKLVSWLEKALSGKSLISSVLFAEQKQRIDGITMKAEAEPVKRLDSWGSSISVSVVGGLLGMGGVWVANAALVDAGGMFPLWWTAVTAIGGIVTTGPSLFSWMYFSSKHDKTVWKDALSIQSEGVRAWLQVRHEITVSDDVIQEIATNMLTNRTYIYFTDTDNRNWLLRMTGNHYEYQLEPAPIYTKTDVQITSLQQAPVTITIGASSLPESAQKVVDSIDTRLSQLHKFALSTEQSHVVARTVEDAREAVAAFERLDALGAGESGLERLTTILSLLDGELEKIVQARIAEESIGFAARQKSVEARVSGVGA